MDKILDGNRLLIASQGGDIETVKKCLEYNIDPNFSHPSSGDTALHFASYFDELDIVLLLLGHEKVIPSCTNHRGFSCLHHAAVANSLRVLEILLYHPNKIFIDSVNEWGETPLHLAAAAGHNKVVEFLLNSGASVEIKDKWGRTPSQVAWEQGETATSRLLPKVDIELARTVHLEETSRKYQSIQKEFMEKLLLTNESRAKMINQVEVKHIFTTTPSQHTKTQPSFNPQQKKPLSKLVEYPGDTELVKKSLLDPTIDPAGKDFYGVPALHKFASWDKVDLVELILPVLSSGDVNCQSVQEGWTALHICVDMGAYRTLERLMKDDRISVDIKDKKGRTVKDLALEGGDQEMVKLIDSLLQK